MTACTSLLLAVDASPYAEAAARYAAFLAERLGRPLRAVHVLDARAAVAPSAFGAGAGDVTLFTPPFDPAVEAVLERRAEAVRAETDAQLGRLGAAAKLELLTGVPEAEIVGSADAGTLIIMGKAGERAARGELARLGGVAERTVRRAEGAVLLTPAGFTEPRRRLVGTDGSGEAEAALGNALDLARTLELPVLALSVGADEAAARAVLDRVRGRAAGLTLHTEALRGEAGAAITGAAGAGDLIVIGAFGGGRLAEFFGGSTTAEITTGADVPVLLHS